MGNQECNCKIDFNTAKENYVTAREDERKKIIEFLKGYINEKYPNKGFEVSSRGGMGSPTYGARKKDALKAPYDLRNWKYVELKKTVLPKQQQGILLISLQSFDKDPSTDNHHILMDRVCFNINLGKKDQFPFVVHTGIDLPMDSEKFKILKEELDKIMEALYKQIPMNETKLEDFKKC